MSSNEISVADLGRIVTGRTPPTSDAENFGGDFLFVTPSDLDWKTYYCRSTERTVSSAVRESFGGTFVPEGAVLVTCIGNTIGKCAIAPATCLTNQQINSVIPRERRYSSFIYYLMLNNVGQIRQVGIGGGAATPIVNKSTFSRLRFRVPDKSTWEEIGRILCTYDDLIENNRRRIKLLEDAARLLYREWFVHLRFPGHEHVKVVDGVPEGWGKLTMADIAETVGGGTPSTKISEYWDGGDITWFSPTDLTNNDCLALLDSAKKITEAGLRGSSAKMLPPETILMSSRASIGYFGMHDKAACTNQGFISLIPHDDRYRYFLLYNLMSRKEEIESKAGGTTYKEINKSTFRAMSIIWPSESIAVEFSGFAESVMRQVRNLKQQIARLQQARDLLLPRLMSGDMMC